MKVVFSFLALVFSLNGLAQQDVPAGAIEEPISYKNPYIKGMSLNRYLEQVFHDNTRYLDTTDVAGTGGLCFIKFKVGTSGALQNIEFSMKVNEKLSVLFLKSLKEVNGYWPVKKINGKPVVSEFLILPIYYEYPKKSKTVNIPLDSRDMRQFLNDSKTSQQITVLPLLYLHRGYDYDNTWSAQ